MTTDNGRIPRQLRRALGSVRLHLVVAAFIGGLWIAAAHGYVLEGPHVLDLMAAKLSGVKSLRVDQQVLVEDPDISGEPISLDETVSYLFPGNFRSEILRQDMRRIHVVSKGRSLTILDNKIADSSEGRYDQYKDLLLYNSAQGLQKTLYLHGVDAGISSLGRLGDQIVFVIGANYPDESVSQVWVDKEQFLPLRWLTVHQGRDPSAQEERWEVLYSSWQKIDGTYYPFKIETYHNGRRIRLVRVTKADANVVLGAELFDISRLRDVYRTPETQAPMKDSTPSEMDEVQRTINEFKKKFEP